MRDRFPDNTWISGVAEWRAGIDSIAFTNTQTAQLWLSRIRGAARMAGATVCPRVFVSHKQADKDAALRVAWLAGQEGFDYWLDIIDLNPSLNKQVQKLEAKLRRKLDAFELSVITAAVIEMALLNCTHVLAVMTFNTAASRWVPYEYGRTKDKTAVATGASCWWDKTTLPKADLPEYVHLADVHENEADIRDWFKRERKLFVRCTGGARGSWSVEPKKLPTDDTTN
jgi:hypothetical protein